MGSEMFKIINGERVYLSDTERERIHQEWESSRRDRPEKAKLRARRRIREIIREEILKLKDEGLI